MFDVLWFVLAGFVLGFAASLLWEWLYFRKRRLNWQSTKITQLEEQVQSLQSQLSRRESGFFPSDESNLATGRVPNQSDDFHSGAARLDSEQPADKIPVQRTGTPTSAGPTSAGPASAVPASAGPADDFLNPAQARSRISEFPSEPSSIPSATPRPNAGGEIQGFSIDSFAADALNAPANPVPNPFGNPPVNQPTAAQFSELPQPPATAVEAQSPPLQQQPQQVQPSSTSHSGAPTYSNPAQSRVEKVTAVQAASTVSRSEESDQQPIAFPSNTQGLHPQQGQTESEALGSAASADAWTDVPEDQAVDPSFIRDAYQDSRNQAIDEGGSQHSATSDPTAAFGAEREIGIIGEEANQPVDSEIAQASQQAMSNYDTLYGQQRSEPQALHGGPPQSASTESGPTESGSTESQTSVPAPPQEFGHDADVDFSANAGAGDAQRGENLYADDQYADDEHADDDYIYDDEDMELPTVSKVMTNYQPPDHELSSYEPPSNEPASSKPSSSERTWSEDPSEDEHRYESALTMPAEILNAPSISRPLIRMARRKEMGNGGSLLNRGIQKAAIDYPDDLTKVRGIGSVCQERLYASGIYTWDQLSKSKPETLEAATQARIGADFAEWIAQAQILAQTHQRVGATYSGPMPDDLSVIKGLTPSHMLWLYQNGIASYTQLAQAKKSALTRIFTGVSGANKIDFSTWAQEAKRLARST